jgi:hypothetical protein
MLQCGVLLSGIFLIIAQIFRNGKDGLKKDMMKMCIGVSVSGWGTVRDFGLYFVGK